MNVEHERCRARAWRGGATLSIKELLPIVDRMFLCLKLCDPPVARWVYTEILSHGRAVRQQAPVTAPETVSLIYRDFRALVKGPAQTCKEQVSRMSLEEDHEHLQSVPKCGAASTGREESEEIRAQICAKHY